MFCMDWYIIKNLVERAYEVILYVYSSWGKEVCGATLKTAVEKVLRCHFGEIEVLVVSK